MDTSGRCSNRSEEPNLEEALDLISVSYDLKIQECREQIRRLRSLGHSAVGQTLPSPDYHIRPRRVA